MPIYRTARKDFEYLETLAELEDQVELDSQREELQRSPTKKYAAKIYEDGIGLWFHEHAGEFNDPKVRRIANRYGLT